MSNLVLANYALASALAALSAIVSRRAPEGRPLTAYLAWMALSDLFRMALNRAVHFAPHPLHGIPRLLFHLDVSIVLSWSFLFVACALLYFLGRGARVPIVLWLLATLVAALAYPALTGPRLVKVYTIASTGCLVASAGSILWCLFRRRDAEIGLPHLVIILYTLTDVAMRAVPYSKRLSDWGLVQASNVALLSACIVAHVAWVLRHQHRGREQSAR